MTARARDNEEKRGSRENWFLLNFYETLTVNKWSSGKDNTFCENYKIVTTYVMMLVVYSGSNQRSKMECFAKILDVQKLFHLRYLTGF